MTYRHIFGPVPSRRLGTSLGVDLVPMKTCSLDCIYCECGPTTHRTTMRLEYVPIDAVTAELRHYLDHRPPPDYITLSGSGEPTLHARIGEVIRFIRGRNPRIPVAVLTNGTLFHDDDVRRALDAADVVIPSLDAATPSVFRRINRPDPGLSIEKCIEGLVRWRRSFKGQTWLEVFIVPGTNDTATELAHLKKAIAAVRPDRVQLNTLDRPGTVARVRAATREELERVIALWNLDHCEIIARPSVRGACVAYRDDVESAILETIRRRPCTVDDLSKILGRHAGEINKYLDVLETQNRVVAVREKRGIFYAAG